MDNASRDENSVPSLLGTSSVDTAIPVPVYADPVTHALYVSISTTMGTVTSFSFTDDNGFTGVVTNATSTPNLTIDVSALDATKIADGTVTNSEFQYLGGVTSDIQTQINSKGSGTVISASVVTANGFAGSVATATTTPAITVSTTITGILQGDGTAISAATTTGSGSVVLGTSPTLTTPNLGTPSALVLTNATGTPSSIGLANGTGLPVSTGISGLGTGVATFLATPSSANLAAAVTGETGSGALVFGTSPDFTTGATIGSVAIPTISSTNTLTNKRITRRLTTVNAPGATPSTNTDNMDIANFTGLGTAITSMTTNLSGTPTDGQLIEFRFTDDGTARGITWGASFGSTTVTLPTTTVISTMLRVLCEWNGSIWQCIATA